MLYYIKQTYNSPYCPFNEATSPSSQGWLWVRVFTVLWFSSSPVIGTCSQHIVMLGLGCFSCFCRALSWWDWSCDLCSEEAACIWGHVFSLEVFSSCLCISRISQTHRKNFYIKSRFLSSWAGVLVSWDSYKKASQTQWPEQKFIMSQFWNPDVLDQGMSKAIPSEDCEKEPALCPSSDILKNKRFLYLCIWKAEWWGGVGGGRKEEIFM